MSTLISPPTHQQDLHPDHFQDRHIGPRLEDQAIMLKQLGYGSLKALMQATVPSNLLSSPPSLPPATSESKALERMRQLSQKNLLYKNYIGLGYTPCITPPPIRRHILENPGWYTQYTPYQAEISQGRLEALLNFQTMVADLTGLPLANASLLDESTAAAEAMTLALRVSKNRSKEPVFLVDPKTLPQTIEVMEGRAKPLGIKIIKDLSPDKMEDKNVYGVLLSHIDREGLVQEHHNTLAKAKEFNLITVVASDLLLLTLTQEPGAWGADICVGNTQRFGMPIGLGGPHAGFLSCHEKYKRQIPGRLVGVSKDRLGNSSFRLALQTREQHIRRDKATSNICTAQALPAIVSSMYAVYHGPKGLKKIAQYLHRNTQILAHYLQKLGYELTSSHFFDTLTLRIKDTKELQAIQKRADEHHINLNFSQEKMVTIALNETTTLVDLWDIIHLFQPDWKTPSDKEVHELSFDTVLTERASSYMEHENFHRYHSETELLRYIKSLESRDLSLTHAMIPLGSCTMKLNSVSEMEPISLPGFAEIHPFAPRHQMKGYLQMMHQLSDWLAELTGFAGVSLQPNSGAQGEYTGLQVIQAYHQSRGDHNRTVCLIPTSAHGTNPASAHMAGMKVVQVRCLDNGNIDLADLKEKAQLHSKELAAMMVTYPSTHGVFEDTILEAIETIHQAGGQVYLDGANMNAMVGWCYPGRFGADVCHLNLHKTFCIPHGGGGPGMGPICVQEHLIPFLPGHPLNEPSFGEPHATEIKAVSESPWGSPLILPITYNYIAMMGSQGLKEATAVAVLNANYIAHRLKDYFEILYTGQNDRVAHECIIDIRPFKTATDIGVEDVAKRLIDYGFHAPTMSWPVAGTLMIEPTESESKEEIDRFCDALISIYHEIKKVEEGHWTKESNPVKMAPHTQLELIAEKWEHPYSREVACFPAEALKNFKFWPYCSRVDNTYGDRNLVCSCQGWLEMDES